MQAIIGKKYGNAKFVINAGKSYRGAVPTSAVVYVLALAPLGNNYITIALDADEVVELVTALEEARKVIL